MKGNREQEQGSKRKKQQQQRTIRGACIRKLWIYENGRPIELEEKKKNIQQSIQVEGKKSKCMNARWAREGEWKRERERGIIVVCFVNSMNLRYKI